MVYDHRNISMFNKSLTNKSKSIDSQKRDWAEQYYQNI